MSSPILPAAPDFFQQLLQASQAGNSILGTLFGQQTSSTTSTDPSSSTTQQVVDPAAIGSVVRGLLEGNNGVASIYSNNNRNGIYASSQAGLMQNDLIARIVGEVGKLTATTVNNRSGTSSTTNTDNSGKAQQAAQAATLAAILAALGKGSKGGDSGSKPSSSGGSRGGSSSKEKEPEDESTEPYLDDILANPNGDLSDEEIAAGVQDNEAMQDQIVQDLIDTLPPINIAGDDNGDGVTGDEETDTDVNGNEIDLGLDLGDQSDDTSTEDDTAVDDTDFDGFDFSDSDPED